MSRSRDTAWDETVVYGYNVLGMTDGEMSKELGVSKTRIYQIRIYNSVVRPKCHCGNDTIAGRTICTGCERAQKKEAKKPCVVDGCKRSQSKKNHSVLCSVHFYMELKKTNGYNKKYYDANRDKLIAYSKEWQKSNKDKTRLYKKRWREKKVMKSVPTT